LWDKTVAPYLQKDLSSDAESYDATNFLMLPLHAAFELGSAPPAWKMQFSDNFALWAADGYPEASNHLNRLQYLYLPSRFLVLSYRHQQKNLVTSSLPNALFAQVRDLWLTLPAGQWNHADFSGIKARLQYKHSLINPAKSFYQGIVDEDFFLFAIAADLKAVRNMAPSEHPEWDPVLDDILASAHQVFGEYGVLEPDGGWLMQPGVYWDHPDYLYAERSTHV